MRVMLRRRGRIVYQIPIIKRAASYLTQKQTIRKHVSATRSTVTGNRDTRNTLVIIRVKLV